MAINIPISIDWPPLPEGYKERPDAFLQWMSENMIVTADGDFLAGQIGGSRPTQDQGDIGIWFGDDSIEKYRDGEYVPITDVPIGGVMMWPCLLPAPVFYIFGEGQSLLRSDYAALFAVYGITWGHEDDLHFNVPDYRGRYPVGANGIVNVGPGDLSINADYPMKARLRDKDIGSYYGVNYPHNQVGYPGGPTGTMGARKFTSSALDKPGGGNPGTIEGPQTPNRFIIRYR